MSAFQAPATRPVPSQVDVPTLSYTQNTFVLRSRTAVESVPLVPTLPPATLSMAYRRDGAWAVWDERGITTRRGNWAISDALTGLPVSPRFFTTEEIKSRVEAFRSGVRSAKPSGISGSGLVGTRAYFVPRWTDAAGKTWLELLVSVDLTQPRPKVQVDSKLPGFTPARGFVDQFLTVDADDLRLLIQSDRGWGWWTYRRRAEEGTFRPVGGFINDWQRIGEVLWAIDQGTSVADWSRLRRIDLESGSSESRFDHRGRIRLIDAGAPGLIAVSRGDGEVVRRSDTGEEISVPKDLQFVRRNDVLIGYRLRATGQATPDAAVAIRLRPFRIVATMGRP